MIRLVLEIDDCYTWAECTKEAVAVLLEPLGTVRVLAVKTDKPEQTRMEPQKPAPAAQSLHTVCPKCGERVISVPGPEGTPALRDIRPRPVWLTTGRARSGSSWWMRAGSRETSPGTRPRCTRWVSGSIGARGHKKRRSRCDSHRERLRDRPRGAETLHPYFKGLREECQE